MAGVFVAISVSAQADSTLLTRRSIQEVYKLSDAAIARKDAKTLLIQLAPNYQLINIKGRKLNRSDMNHMMRLWFSSSKRLTTKTSIKKFYLDKGQARVIFAERAEAAGLNPQTKKIMNLVVSSTGEDIWVRIKGKWLKQKTRTLSMNLIIDGKPRKI